MNIMKNSQASVSRQRRNGDYTVMHCAGVFSQIKNFACDRQKIKNFRRFFSC